MSAPATASSDFLRRLWLDVRALALPIGGFWAATIVGLLTMSACIVLVSTDAPDAAIGAAVLGGVWLGTVGGLLVGQGLALLRLRTPWMLLTTGVIYALFLATLGGSAIAAGQLEQAEPILIVGIVAGFFFPMFLATGHWSLSTHTGMLATFGPLMWFTASILIISEKTGDAARWFEGDKWAIWGVFTVPILGAGVGFVLLYLTGRELHRLHAWRYSPQGPDLPAGDASVVGLRSAGCGSLLALFVLAVPLTVGTALVAPYFFRSETGEDGPGTPVEPTDPGDPAPAQPQPDPNGDPMQQIQQAASEAARALITLLMVLLFTLLAILVFGPPLRRMLLLQYLRTPFWPVPPTRRVAQHWRLVEIALADAGLHRQPGDSATALAKRAMTLTADGTREVALLDPESLTRAAEVADRVAYGVGIAHDDVMIARRAAEMTYQSVWDDLSEWGRWKAMYRLL